MHLFVWVDLDDIIILRQKVHSAGPAQSAHGSNCGIQYHRIIPPEAARGDGKSTPLSYQSNWSQCLLVKTFRQVERPYLLIPMLFVVCYVRMGRSLWDSLYPHQLIGKYSVWDGNDTLHPLVFIGTIDSQEREYQGDAALAHFASPSTLLSESPRGLPQIRRICAKDSQSCNAESFCETRRTRWGEMHFG